MRISLDIRHPILAAAIALVAWSPGASAVEDPKAVGPSAFFTESPLGPVDAITSRCPAPTQPICAYNYPVIEQACEVVEVKDLGVLGKSQYLLIRFTVGHNARRRLPLGGSRGIGNRAEGLADMQYDNACQKK